MRGIRLCAALAASMATTAFAQRPDPAFEGPRGVFGIELSMGEPVSFFLEWSRELELTDPQRSKLISIRRRLRVANGSFAARLDSIATVAGVDFGDRGRLSRRDQEAIEKFNKLAEPTLDSIRANNDVARGEIDAVLERFQAARADSIRLANRSRTRPERRQPARSDR